MYLWNVAAEGGPDRAPATSEPIRPPPVSWPRLRLVGGAADREPSMPMEPEELRGCYRLRRLIEPELAAEACPLLQPAQLDELRSRIPYFTTCSDQVCAALRDFHIELLRPAASRWDLHVLRPLWEETDRVTQALFGRHGRSAAHVIHCVLGCHELLDAYCTRDPDTARAASARYLDGSERMVERLLASTT
ncbi:MAG: FCD domain-containing protein [Pseudonocardia sp.]|nr:FCD domain-containing protein [Pseudonocardia sp.]